MGNNKVKKRTHMVNQNSLGYKKRSVFTLLFVAFLMFSIFSVYAQENSEGGVNSLTENTGSPLVESAPNEETVNIHPDSDSGESKEVYVNLDDLIEDKIVVEGEVVLVNDEETVDVVTADEIVSQTGEEENVYVELEQVEQVKVEDVSQELKKEEVYLPIEEINEVNGGSGNSNNLVNGEEKSEEKIVPVEVLDESSAEEVAAQEDNSFEEVSAIINNEEKDEISYVFYKDNKKVIETRAEEGLDLKIIKEESLASDGEEWKKDVKVYSEEHYKNELTVYADIQETKEENIQIYWKEENKYLDFNTYDKDGNGLIEKVSWIVPHLSEQNFEIIVNFTQILNQSASLIINTISSPSGSITNSNPLAFQFGINYTNPQNVTCDFELKNESGVSVNQQTNSAGSEWNLEYGSLTNGAYLWEMNCADLANNQTSNTLAGNFLVNIYYAPPTPQVSFTVNDNSIDEGQSVTFYVNVTNATTTPRFYTINFGDGESPYNSGDLGDTQFSHTRSHTYSNDGTFTARLTGTLGSTTIDKTIQISVVNTVSVDNEDPKVELGSPVDNQNIVLDSFSDEVTFSYNASDNVKVDNCTVSIYYYNYTQIGSLVFTDFDSSVNNGEYKDLKLKEFDEGDYTWDVECFDNSSNSRDSTRDFSLTYSGSIQSASAKQNTQELSTTASDDFERSDEINGLIDKINNFLIEEEKYGVEEKEAVEDLRIIDDLKFYKKKLLQMKTDLSHNLQYIDGEENRQKRKQEIFAEFDDLSEKTVIGLNVLDSREYTKNILDSDFEDIVKAYAEAKNIKLTSSNIKDMAKQNEAIQNKITVSVRTKQVEVEYQDRTEKITLVTKMIKFKDREFDSIIEIIPKEIAKSDSDITFLNERSVLRSDPIFEIKLDSITDDKIVYYFNSLVNLEEIETTTTASFVEEIPKENLGAISGFATFVGGGAENGILLYLSWVIAFFVVLFVLFVSVQRMRISGWKKDENFRKLYGLVNETRVALKNKDIDSARSNYNEAEMLYPNLPQKSKKYVFSKITKLNVEIDKKDIVNLVKEFVIASKEGRRDDAILLYENIQSLYPRMSKGFKKKVFDKMRPHVKKLRG